ncbi:MAG: hypothetical protein A3I29_04120 [Candidatus Magasanikbacteria bacterium RIFCSPLOWO2_02_FULL_44_11]|uniref:Glycosyl transferase family 1 domain-containing protein n=2 Tax=Candidatus Magasanikiibacteriota TaxID=1752731 RepID=A0A1F6N9P3_9BACT|nr:MAG: hypothetical protein A3D53_02870 [Candidatus Magasanikbacteria bacterium RIFCSPHIGHO2_02_FULL_45_10]OGH80599.1 MAG: hypothetical protein A3I29_04120 [Candidatus Magasanikbacteria bacterium RIFCSPLOWO2_02_FULL_44_11]
MDKCAAINVLELISSLNYAGSQRALVNFCRYSDRHFFKMHVATYIEGGPREKEIHDLGIECVIFKNDIASLLKYVAQKNIQIVHFHRSGHYVPFEHLVLQKLKSQNPLLVIVETNIFGKYDARSASLIDCSLVISKMNLNEVFVKQAGVFDFNRMRTLYFPVDAASFAKNIPTQEEITAYKKKNNIQPADFVIGRLGRPDIAKWSDLLIETVPYLVKLIPRIKYLIQSAPESRKRQVLTGRYRDNFIFVEPSAEDKDIALFFSSLDVYAHASKIGESFGMTLAEAGLFKKPVVVNSTPQRDNSQVEVVNHMQTGIIANGPQAFARAVAYLYAHPKEKERMGEAARFKVLQEYDAEATTRCLEKVFVEKLLQKNIPVCQTVIDLYAKINYFPSENDLVAYRKDYQKRIANTFSPLTNKEMVYNALFKPKKMYRKVIDFIEHRFKQKKMY